MSIKLMHIAAVLIVIAPLPVVAAPPGHRTLQSRIDDYNACTNNGGDMGVCCAIAGGDYEPPHTVTVNGRQVTVESCMIAAMRIQHTIGGKTIIMKIPAPATSISN